MGFIDSIVPPGKIITIHYRDKYVDLVSDTGHYGTMTQTEDRVEFDFSECRVIGTRDVWPMPVVVDPNAPKDGIIVTREQLQAAAKQIASGE